MKTSRRNGLATFAKARGAHRFRIRQSEASLLRNGEAPRIPTHLATRSPEPIVLLPFGHVAPRPAPGREQLRERLNYQALNWNSQRASARWRRDRVCMPFATAHLPTRRRIGTGTQRPHTEAAAASLRRLAPALSTQEATAIRRGSMLRQAPRQVMNRSRFEPHRSAWHSASVQPRCERMRAAPSNPLLFAIPECRPGGMSSGQPLTILPPLGCKTWPVMYEESRVARKT